MVTHVEKFAGVSGGKDNIDVLPNSETQPGFDLSCIEKHFKESIKKHYGDTRHLV